MELWSRLANEPRVLSKQMSSIGPSKFSSAVNIIMHQVVDLLDVVLQVELISRDPLRSYTYYRYCSGSM